MSSNTIGFMGTLIAFLLAPCLASAQSMCSSIVYNAVMTAAQWQLCFQSKQDLLGYTAVNKAGDVMTGGLSATELGLNGDVAFFATAPIISTGFCMSPTISGSNGSAAFEINIGSSCAAYTGSLTMPSATNGWACTFRDMTNPAGNKPDQTGSTPTTVSVTNYSRTSGAATNWTASDVVVGSCTAY